MYLPNHFARELNDARSIIDRYSFATLISVDATGLPMANHIPLLAEYTSEGRVRLEGHMARRNPQWQHFKNGAKALAVFSGPHAYITPKWYVSGRDVPTWNYAVVHASGTVKLIEDFEGLTSMLQRLTVKFEAGSEASWEFELPSDLEDPRALTSAIIGFVIEVDDLQIKFKLSQNRSDGDQRGIIDGLGTREDEMSLGVRELMLRGKE